MDIKVSMSANVTGYELAYRLAREQLTEIDIEEQCRKSSARYIDSQKVVIAYLNQSYLITLPGIDISLMDSDEKVPPRAKILILHYLTLAKGTPFSNKVITFKELPEGANYFPSFFTLISHA